MLIASPERTGEYPVPPPFVPVKVQGGGGVGPGEEPLFPTRPKPATGLAEAVQEMLQAHL